MNRKILTSIIVILFVSLSLISFEYYRYRSSTQPLIEQFFSLEKKVQVIGKVVLACSTRVYDKDTSRLISSHNYSPAVNEKCPQDRPVELYLSKSDYIKEIQNSDTWGIFDYDYINPEAAKPRPENWKSIYPKSN